MPKKLGKKTVYEREELEPKAPPFSILTKEDYMTPALGTSLGEMLPEERFPERPQHLPPGASQRGIAFRDLLNEARQGISNTYKNRAAKAAFLAKQKELAGPSGPLHYEESGSVEPPGPGFPQTLKEEPIKTINEEEKARQDLGSMFGEEAPTVPSQQSKEDSWQYLHELFGMKAPPRSLGPDENKRLREKAAYEAAVLLFRGKDDGEGGPDAVVKGGIPDLKTGYDVPEEALEASGGDNTSDENPPSASATPDTGSGSLIRRRHPWEKSKEGKEDPERAHARWLDAQLGGMGGLYGEGIPGDLWDQHKGLINKENLFSYLQDRVERFTRNRKNRGDLTGEEVVEAALSRPEEVRALRRDIDLGGPTSEPTKLEEFIAQIGFGAPMERDDTFAQTGELTQPETEAIDAGDTEDLGPMISEGFSKAVTSSGAPVGRAPRDKRVGPIQKGIDESDIDKTYLEEAEGQKPYEVTKLKTQGGYLSPDTVRLRAESPDFSTSEERLHSRLARVVGERGETNLLNEPESEPEIEGSYKEGLRAGAPFPGVEEKEIIKKRPETLEKIIKPPKGSKGGRPEVVRSREFPPMVRRRELTESPITSAEKAKILAKEKGKIKREAQKKLDALINARIAEAIKKGK